MWTGLLLVAITLFIGPLAVRTVAALARGRFLPAAATPASAAATHLA